MRRALIIAVCLTHAAACNNGSGRELEAPPPSPLLAGDIVGELQLGSGIIGPNRVAAWPGDPGRLLVATGRGESFGQSYLHLVTTADLVELAAPLPVGRNVSDLAWVGGHLVVAARSSNELILVDPVAWEVVDTLALGFPPIAITALSESTAAVSSTGSDGSLIVAEATDAGLSIAATQTLDAFARDLTYDAASNRIFAIGPRLGMVSIDPESLQILSRVSVPGTLGFGSTMAGETLISTDRDGYVHVWNPDSGVLRTIDLAPVLGLDRSQVALRGIDPIEVVQLDEGYVAVLNQRQNSIVFSFDAAQQVPLSPVAEFSKGAYGIFLPGSREILWPESVADRIRRAILPNDYSTGAVEVIEQSVGIRVIDAVPLSGTSENRLAVLVSDGRILIVDDRANRVSELNSDDVQWRAPIAGGPGGSILVLVPADGGPERLWQYDIGGTKLAEYAMDVSPAYSIAATDERILATGRLTGEVQLIDLAIGESEKFELSRSRPRSGVLLGEGRAVVFHDTSPDIGVTLLANNKEQGFNEVQLDRWWSHAYAMRSTAFASTFGGTIAEFDADARLSDFVSIDFDGVKHIAPGAGDISWIVSENLGAALAVSLPRREIERRVDIPELFKLYESEAGFAWAVTVRRVVSFDNND